MNVSTNTRRLFALALLATGCAATADPGPRSSRALETAAAPVIDPEVSVAPTSIEDFAFSLLPPLSGATVGNTNQDPAAASPATKSPHGFSGGVGVRFRDGESAIDLLAQYQYYVNPKLDIGAIGDWAMSPIDTFLIAPAAWWHPTERLTLFGAPGVEFASGDGAEAALRLGGSYTFILGKLVVRPFGWYDFVTDRKGSMVFGVGFGI